MAFSGVRSWWSSRTSSGGPRRPSAVLHGAHNFLPQDSVIISERTRRANKLGEGSFAKVFKGEYNGKPCAVKVFKEDVLKKELAPDLWSTSEVELVSKVQHMNIVQMYGKWFDPHKDRAAPSIVMELCDESLYDFIRRFKGKTVPKEKKLSILQDIARGMVYLHSQNIVHGDLRSSNVLLCHSEDQTVAKIADFDIARFLDTDAQHHFTGMFTAEEYLPPEVFDHKEHKDQKKWARLTPKVDVFCFGELVLELGCGTHPTPTGKFRGGEMLTELQRREKHLAKLKQSDKESLGSIIRKCLADAPEGRPSSTEILLEVEGYLHTYGERSDLEMLQDKTAECEALRAEALKWEDEAKSLSSMQDVLERELEKEKAEKQEFQIILQIQQTQVEELQQQIQEISQREKDAAEQSLTMSTRLQKTLDEAKTAAEKQLDKTKKERDALREDLQAAHEALSKKTIEHAEALKEVASLIEALEQKAGNIRELQSTSHDQEKIIQQSNRDRLNVLQEVEQLRNERDTFKQKLVDAQTSLKTSKEHTTRVEEQLDQFQKKLREKEFANAKLLRALNDKEGEMKEMKQQKAKLESSAKRQDDRIRQLKTKADEMDVQLQRERHEWASQRNALQQQNAELQKKASEMGEQLKRESKKWESENTALKLEIVTGKEHAKKTTDQLEQAAATRDRMVTELQHLREQCDHLELEHQQILAKKVEELYRVKADLQAEKDKVHTMEKAALQKDKDLDQCKTELRALRAKKKHQENAVMAELQEKLDRAENVRVKLMGEMVDQKKREAALCDNVKELEQQHSDLTRKLSECEAQRDSLQTEKADLLHRNQQLEVDIQQQTLEREKVLKEKENYLKQYEDVERKLQRLSSTHVKKMAESEKEIQRLKDLLEKARKEQLTVQALAHEQKRQQTNEQGEKMKLMEEVANYRAQESVLKQRVEQKQSELSEMAAMKNSLDAQLVTVIEEKRALLSTERELTSKMEQTQKELKRMTLIAEKSAKEKDKEFQECQQLKDKAARLQGELAESQRASESQKNELVVTQAQRQLAEKERDELAEKYHGADQLICRLKQEAEGIREDLQNIKEKNAELRGQLGVVVENKHELEALRLKCSSAVAEKARTEEKLLAASNQVLKLEEEAGEAKRQLHEAEGRCSDLEADKAKLQASQKFAEELEAEKDDYKGKLSNANELIMQHLSSQTKGGFLEHLPSKTEFHAMMEFFKVFYDKSSKQSEHTAEENQRLLAENNELKEKVQEMVQESLTLQEKLSEKQKFLDEQQGEMLALREQLSLIQEMEVAPVPLTSDVIEETGDEVVLQQLCYMATGIKELLVGPCGGTFVLGSGDATLEFPPGAIEKETSVKYAVILHGPFVFPAGHNLVSVVVYLNMEGAILMKPVLLYLSHWRVRKDGEDADDLTFATAPHTLMEGQEHYQFEEQGEADFITHTNVGILKILEPRCLHCVKGKPGEIARYRAITFTKYIKEEEEETLLFRIQFMCDSEEWNKGLLHALQDEWKQTSRGGVVTRFEYTPNRKPIAASPDKETGPGWIATLEGLFTVQLKAPFLAMAKSKFEVAQAIRSGQLPPCIMYHVLYTVPEDQRVNRAKLTVALRGEDLDLSFNCPIMEAVSAQSVKSATSLSSPKADISNTAVIKALNHELDARWREFGTHLCVKSAIMDIIDKNKKSDVGACMLHLVENWLAHDNGTGDLPRTWETVVQAVKSTGKGRLAEQLAQQHGVQLSGQ